jgi:hypothetical protein
VVLCPTDDYTLRAMPGKKKTSQPRPLTVREALERSGVRAHIFADSAEGIRAPRSRKAIQEVSEGMRQIFLSAPAG